MPPNRLFLHYLPSLIVVLCTVGAVFFLARDISRIEAALPLASLHKERDFTAFHLDLARLEAALELTVAAPTEGHGRQVGFALDLALLRLNDNRMLYGASDRDLAAMQRQLGVTFGEIETALSSAPPDPAQLRPVLDDLARQRRAFQSLADNVFQTSMDQVSAQREYLTGLRDSMVLLLGLFGLGGLALVVLLHKQQGGIRLLEGQGEALRSREDKLRRSEALLLQSQRIALIGHYVVDFATGAIQSSQTLDDICGVDAAYPHDIDGWLALVHPDDRETMSADLYQGVLREHKLSNREYRIVRPRDGAMRWVHGVGQIELDPSGRPLRLFGTVQDITERQRAEERQRLAASVFKSSQEGIVIADAANRILDVNDAFTAITGYARDEVLGRNPKLLRSGSQDPAFYQAMWRSLADTGRWRGEIWNRRKSGERYAELLSIVAVPDANGRIQNYVGIFSDISRLKEHEAELDRIAHYDVLTGIPNRRLFSDRLDQAIVRARRTGQSLAVCYLDLDGFKPINDRLGHEAGDRVLVAVTRNLQDVLRAGDTLARLGGDEFVLLFADLGQERECFPILDRVLAAVALPTDIAGNAVSVSASVGVTLYPRDGADADGLLRHADQAMYLAKDAGKNRYHLYNPERD